ncbi:MAG: hypothetical protein ACK58Q_09635, partial [Chitinophagales bacterium]
IIKEIIASANKMTLGSSDLNLVLIDIKKDSIDYGIGYLTYFSKVEKTEIDSNCFFMVKSFCDSNRQMLISLSNYEIEKECSNCLIIEQPLYGGWFNLDVMKLKSVFGNFSRMDKKDIYLFIPFTIIDADRKKSRFIQKVSLKIENSDLKYTNVKRFFLAE